MGIANDTTETTSSCKPGSNRTQEAIIHSVNNIKPSVLLNRPDESRQCLVGRPQHPYQGPRVKQPAVVLSYAGQGASVHSSAKLPCLCRSNMTCWLLIRHAPHDAAGNVQKRTQTRKIQGAPKHSSQQPPGTKSMHCMERQWAAVPSCHVFAD